MDYKEFLQSKQKRIAEAGFKVDESQLNSFLFDFQRHIVTKALKMGRYAIFADCGLGKTLMQLEWARNVSQHTNGAVLILTPLAVSGQTINEGAKFGIQVARFAGQTTAGLYVTNFNQ